MRPSLPSGALCAAFLAAGCHDLFDGVFPYVCDAQSEAGRAHLPARLSETGLYRDIAADELADGVLPYRPRFELWSDGAAKRRWLLLPPGAAIDASDQDDWIFPVGTMAWKEFSRDSVRVETRVLARWGPGEEDWAAQSYVWQDGEDALATPAGFIDAGGTAHDVPAASECAGCHRGRRSFVLGISAIQLGGDDPRGELDLADLAAAGLVSPAPEAPLVLPGGDEVSDALGYLHANCGHCHNAATPANRPCFAPDNDLDFWLRVAELGSVEETAAYRSAVGGAIQPGDAAGSTVVERMSTRDLFTRMPPLGTRQVDADGIAAVRRWIEGLR